MPQLKWTPQALADVERLYDFLAEKNPDAARRAVATIRQGVRILAKQGRLGRPIEDIPLEFREWIIDFGQSAYLVLYHFNGDEIVLLAIRHAREAGYS